MRVDLHMHTGYSADAQYPQSIDDKIHACEQAGLDIIKAGGNAVDAALATAASRLSMKLMKHARGMGKAPSGRERRY